MYSIETLKKFREQLYKATEAFSRIAFENYRQYNKSMYYEWLKKQVCFSNGNSKIGRVLNVSLAPIETCFNCKECMFLCYDIKACMQYKNVMNARARNTYIEAIDTQVYFHAIWNKMERRKKNFYFRFHVGGDIPNSKYFVYMVETAKRFPNWIIWTYTKHYSIVNAWIDENGKLPNNFIVMFSEWDGIPLYNPHGLPVFSCKLKNGNKNHEPEYFDTLYKCPGNCDICKALHKGCIAGQNTYANEH